MPGVLNTGTPNPESSRTEKAELIKLWLPSQLEDSNEHVSLCFPGVIGSEKDLRFGQLQDSLDDLRKARRVRRGLVLFHKVNFTGEGQKVQTKARAAIQTLNDRIAKSIRRYRLTRNALLQLDPGGDWESIYRPFTDADNRGPGKEPEEVVASDGQYTQSWIWCSTTTVVSQDEVNEDMRVEWAQCMARADRWGEEVTLLQEEMRRVVQFLGWRSRDWYSKADARVDPITQAVRAGVSAYAKKQGSIFLNLAIQFSRRWSLTLLSHSLPYTWATDFLNKNGASLIDPDLKKPKKTAESPKVPTESSRVAKPSPLAVPTKVPPPQSPSTASAEDPLPPSNPEVIGDSLQAPSDSEDSAESGSGSDSSSSMIE